MHTFDSPKTINHNLFFFQIHLASVRCICTVIWICVSAEMRGGRSLFSQKLYGRWRCGWSLQTLRKTYGKRTVFHSALKMFFPHMTCKPAREDSNHTICGSYIDQRYLFLLSVSSQRVMELISTALCDPLSPIEDNAEQSVC